MTELLGFLPQELERHSLIKFIHPDDLEKIKQIHYDSKMQFYFILLTKVKLNYIIFLSKSIRW